VDVHLTFVVGGAAAEDIAVADGGFECGGGPEVERFRGLYIVVAIKKDGGLARSFEGFGVNQGMKTGLDDLNGLETGGGEFAGNPVGGALDIRFVFALGADARDAEKFLQLGEMLVAATFNIFSKVHKRGWDESFRVLIRSSIAKIAAG
jgi:hypothetical protein